MGRASGTSLAPGFRFHPTDEELVRYYLKRKLSGNPLRYDPISDVDVYKFEPWDLPDKSRLKSRDLEWYFFSMLDKKYGNGSKTNRATENGYWKTTGKDRPIRRGSRIVGMKKTLVYHSGRAPHGQRSNWVMHEYRMTDEELEKAGIAQDAFVLCRIFQKSGPGPKNGEQYGAPFIEEEWEEDTVALFPEEQAMVDGVVANEDGNVETDDFDQDVTVAIAPGIDPLPENFYYGGTSSDNQLLEEGNEHYQTLPEDVGESQCEEQQPDENKFFILPGEYEYEMDIKPVKREFATQPTDDMNLGDNASCPDGPFMDSADNPLCGDELYLNDLSPSEYPDSFNVEDYLTFTDEDNLMTIDSLEMMIKNGDCVSGEPLPSLEDVCGEIEQMPDTNLHPSVSHENGEASSSRQNSEPEDLKPDLKHTFLKQASHMLGSFPAPPAYASEYPLKDAALRLNSAQHASSSIHVTAGMIRIRNITLSSSGIEWSVGKNGELNIVLSIGISQEDVLLNPSSAYTPALLSSKMPSILSWSWGLFLVFWILVLSVSLKVGMSVYSR